MKQTIFSISAISLLLSCTKHESNITQEVDAKIASITIDVNNFTNYEYDNSGKCIKVTYNYSGGTSTTQNIISILNYENTLLKEVVNSAGKLHYHYTNTQLDSIVAYTLTGEKISVNTFAYNNPRQIASITEKLYKLAAGTPSETKRVFFYSNDNLVKEEYFIRKPLASSLTLAHTTEYGEFDNNTNTENFFISGFFVQNVVFMKNNPRKITLKNEYNLLLNSSKIDYTYYTNNTVKEKIQTTNTASPVTYRYNYHL